MNRDDRWRKPLTFALISLLVTLCLTSALPLVLGRAAEAPEEEIPYGGKLVAGFTADIRSAAIPHADYLWVGLGCVVWPLLYDQIWVLTPEWEYKPWLGYKWDVSEDGLEITVHLIENATFHDGTPVTAEDVAITADYLLKTPAWEGHTRGINYTEVIDEHTVKFHMNAPSNWGRLTWPLWWSPVLPKHIWEAYKDDPLSCPNEEMIGSGPFKLKEWKRDEYWWFEANEDYWAGRPYIDELVFKLYPSLESLILALKAGEIDMIGYGGIPPSSARDLLKTQDITVNPLPGLDIRWLSVNIHENKTGPLKDIEVRRAIAHAVNRDAIIESAYLGYAVKIDSWIYPELPAHNPDLPQYEYDVDLANQILDDAGYLDTDGDGIREDPETGEKMEFELLSTTSTTDVKVVTVVKQSLAYIGIKINARAYDWPTLASLTYDPAGSLYDMAISGEQPGLSGEDWMWAMAATSRIGSWNPSGFSNPEYDVLYDGIFEETDTAKLNEMNWRMAEILAEYLPYIYLVRPDTLSPHRTDNFEGFVGMMGGHSSWVNAWTYTHVHLKEAPEATPTEAPTPEATPTEAPTPEATPTEAPTPEAPAPSPLPWYVASVAVIIAVAAVAYAMMKRG